MVFAHFLTQFVYTSALVIFVVYRHEPYPPYSVVRDTRSRRLCPLWLELLAAADLHMRIIHGTLYLRVAPPYRYI